MEAGGTLHAVVLRAGRVTRHEVGRAADAQPAGESLRAGLRWLAYGSASSRAPARLLELVARSAGTLDRQLLAPLLTGADSSLVLVPTGALHSLPWTALPSVWGRAVSIAPSAWLWHRAALASTARPAGAAGPIVLAHGPDLAHAAAEIDDLAALYGDVIRFDGPRAAVGAVMKALDGSSTVHIAAHGEFRADNPMFSQLRLADGPLTVYDLEQLQSAPRHVVLACCDSGRSEVRRGDELMGMSAALLALGTSTLDGAGTRPGQPGVHASLPPSPARRTVDRRCAGRRPRRDRPGSRRREQRCPARR